MTQGLPSLARLAAALALLLAAPAWSAGGGKASGHDYPTADRVLYVQACMRAHPGHFFEMLNKCSCVLDHLATQLSYDDFVTMDTMVNANSIGGERGNVIRDNEPAQQEVKRYRALQAKAQKGCFLEPPTAAK